MEVTETVEMLLITIGPKASLALMCLIFLIKARRNAKKKKNLENSILLLDAVAPIMEVAEKYVHYTGEEKKEFVLTKINQLAIENKLKFDEVAVSNKIEELITLSKEVNNKQQSTKEKENEER